MDKLKKAGKFVVVAAVTLAMGYGAYRAYQKRVRDRVKLDERCRVLRPRRAQREPVRDVVVQAVVVRQLSEVHLQPLAAQFERLREEHRLEVWSIGPVGQSQP